MKHKLILFGTGSSSEKIQSLINEKDNNIIGYVDNNVEKQGGVIFGRPIWHPSVLCDKEFDYIIICSIYFTEILSQLLEMGIQTNKIINIYQEIRYNELKLKFSEIKNDTDMLITGMSYARYGIDSKLLNLKSINLAFNSQDIFYDYCLAKYILESYKLNIKYALIGLAYFSFHFDLSQSKERHLVTRYAVIKDIQKQVNQQKYDEFVKPNEEKMQHPRNFNFLNGVFEKTFLDKFDFLEQNDKNYRNFEIERRDLARVHSGKKYLKTLEENKKYLDSYIRLLLEKGIKPIFIIHPQACEYREHFNPKMIGEFKEIINKFKFNYNISVVDLFSSNEFTNDDFFDVHHLNSQGATKVSKIINNILES
ncbi:nucleoside-diphosphate sugar epimerase/dehydratase [Gracilibacillus phocaeensis]|uniref:nucleoside-diphosphate sugar epimerase/dehydratase n=1 Tax=Gracilibacillus phocaeensis TaxID=2042304 RepID=UPI0013EF1DEE|nr:hypothetical protein [Gracilibacillus phocaeensis]